MVSTFSSNIQLEEPARGDDVGTWDTPVNNNMTLLDLVCGGNTTISLNNANITLSAGQFKSKLIVFNSTLTGSVTITFPTSFTKSYEVYNACSGTSAFTITLATTASGGSAVALPPGEIKDVINTGVSMVFKNLGYVGQYWDYAGSSLPNWVSACTVPPYLYCDGSTFSSATYPQLTMLLGGTTLPDMRGRTRFSIDAGAGRLSSGTIGFNPNTALAAGGSQTATLQTSNLPPYTPAGTVANTPPAVNIMIGGAGGAGPAFNQNPAAAALAGQNADTSIFTGTPAAGQVSNPLPIIPPALIGGITMIRSA
jgi:Phage Tail Collar Domain